MGDPLVFLWFAGLLLFLLGNGRLADLVKLLSNIKPATTAPTSTPTSPQVVNAATPPGSPPVDVNPQSG